MTFPLEGKKIVKGIFTHVEKNMCGIYMYVFFFFGGVYKKKELKVSERQRERIQSERRAPCGK